MHYAQRKQFGYSQVALSPAPAYGKLPYGLRSLNERVNTKLNCDSPVEAGNVIKALRYGSPRIVVERRGQYVKVRPLDGVITTWANVGLYTFAAVDLREWEWMARIAELERERDNAKLVADREARQKLIDLSRNTVTRALVHAASNDYCSETAVALISAGHKLPDVTLQIDVTLRVDLVLEGNKSYYPLRDLFGATQGNVQGARGIDIHTDRLHSKLREHFGDDKFEYVTDVKLCNADVQWHAPMIRQLSTNEAVREYEMSIDND